MSTESEIPAAPTKVGMFEEAPGETSSTRVKCFLCLLASFGAGWVCIARNSEMGLWVFSALLVAAFAPQAVQKFAELKYSK